MGKDTSAAVAGTVTRLIGQIESGNEAAEAELCELVYQELRAIGRRVRRRGPKCSLDTADVIHEFLGRFLSDGRLGQMNNRRYFYAAAADQMRRLIIDYWRKKKTERRGGYLKREPLDPWLDELTDSTASRCGGDLEALDQSLARLKRDRPRQHAIVQMKFFAGLTNEQVAETLEISIDTVKRDWRAARARVKADLSDDL